MNIELKLIQPDPARIYGKMGIGDGRLTMEP